MCWSRVVEAVQRYAASNITPGALIAAIAVSGLPKEPPGSGAVRTRVAYASNGRSRPSRPVSVKALVDGAVAEGDDQCPQGLENRVSGASKAIGNTVCLEIFHPSEVRTNSSSHTKITGCTWGHGPCFKSHSARYSVMRA